MKLAVCLPFKNEAVNVHCQLVSPSAVRQLEQDHLAWQYQVAQPENFGHTWSGREDHCPVDVVIVLLCTCRSLIAVAASAAVSLCVHFLCPEMACSAVQCSVSDWRFQNRIAFFSFSDAGGGGGGWLSRTPNTTASTPQCAFFLSTTFPSSSSSSAFSRPVRSDVCLVHAPIGSCNPEHFRSS